MLIVVAVQNSQIKMHGIIQKGRCVNLEFFRFFFLCTMVRDVEFFERVWVSFFISSLFFAGHLYQRFQLAGLLQRYSFQCGAATTQRTWRKKEISDSAQFNFFSRLS